MLELTLKKQTVSGCELVNILKEKYKLSKKYGVEQGFKAYWIPDFKGYQYYLEEKGYKWCHSPYLPVGVTVIGKTERTNDNDELVVIYIWKESQPKKKQLPAKKIVQVNSSLLDNL